MALAVVTLLFNIILVWQHYVFYFGNEHDASEQEPLLRGGKKTKFYAVDVNAEDGDFLVRSVSLSAEQNSGEVKRSERATHNSQESPV